MSRCQAIRRPTPAPLVGGSDKKAETRRAPVRAQTLGLVCCVLVILGSLAVHLVAGSLCLSARSLSGCQNCCQPQASPDPTDSASPETGTHRSACSLFCCTQLPGAAAVPIPPALAVTVFLPGIQALSTYLSPALPPPRLSLAIAQPAGELLPRS